MAQTAATFSEQYLQVTDKENKTLPVDSFTLSGNVISFPSIEENKLFEQVSPFYYRNRARISFSISEEFQAHFVMIKGLIEFNRLKHFSFSYNLEQRTFETDVEVNQITDLQLLLNKVLILLQQEIRFKQALKLVLQFENRYKREMAKVYNTLNDTSLRA